MVEIAPTTINGPNCIDVNKVTFHSSRILQSFKFGAKKGATKMTMNENTRRHICINMSNMDPIDWIGSIVIEWTNQFHSVIGSIKSSACRNPVWRGQVVGCNLNLNENERGKGHETNTTHIWASFAAVGLEPSPSSRAVEPTAICGRGTAVEPAHAPLLLLQSATFSAS